MATKKVSPKKVSVLDADQIISAYMEDVLNHEKKPNPISFQKAKGKNPTKKPNIRLKILHRHNKYLKISKSGV